MHERLRQHALAAWEALQRGEPNPLPDLIGGDADLQAYASETQLIEWMDGRGYLGDAPRRARLFAAELRMRLSA